MFAMYQVIVARALPPILATLLGVATIMICDRREPLDISSLTITPSPVRPGEASYIIFQARELRACEGNVHRWVEDSSGRVFTFAPEPTIYPALLEKTSRQFVKQFTIPFGIAGGPATYHSDIQRWCNGLQWAVWRFHYSYTAPFVVATIRGGGENAPVAEK
jgi:hypothetical protein